MKKINYLIFSILFIILSCSKDDPQIKNDLYGKVSFSFKTKKNSSNKAILDETPKAIVITVIDEDDKVIFENKSYNLTDFNGSYLTEDIELSTGNYKLTGFNVVNENNEVIFSSPKEGSEFANLVSKPLPISFIVTENETINIIPEVLRINTDDTPESFGYVTFGFNIIETQNFYITLIDKSVTPNVSTTGSFEMNIADKNFTKSMDLVTGANKVRIPLISDTSKMVLKVNSGSFPQQEITLNATDIDAADINNPYKVLFGNTNTPITPEISEGKLELVSTSTINTSTTPSIELLDNFTDLETFNGKEYTIGTDAGYANIVEIVSDETTVNNYKLSNHPNISLNKLFIADGLLFALGTDGDIFYLNIIDKNYIRYKYPLDKILTINNGLLFATKGNHLYKSSISSPTPGSFNLIPDGHGLFNSPSDMIYLNQEIFIIDTEGQLYKSTDQGKTFVDITNMGTSYYKLYNKASDELFIYGDDGIFTVFNTKTYITSIIDNQFNDVNNGKFVSYTSVDTDEIFHFEKASFFKDVTTGGFSTVRRNYTLTDAITASNMQEVYGISGNTLYFNLR